MRVLYVNHTSDISGAEHSLLVLVGALPSGVAAEVTCPNGTLAEEIRALGLPVHPLATIRCGLRLGVRSAATGLCDVARVALTIARLSRRRDIA
jgi:hypothetical protein